MRSQICLAMAEEDSLPWSTWDFGGTNQGPTVRGTNTGVPPPPPPSHPTPTHPNPPHPTSPASPHHTSPHRTSHHLTSCHLMSPHLTPLHRTAPHPHLTSPYLTPPHPTPPTPPHPTSPHVTHLTSPHLTKPTRHVMRWECIRVCMFGNNKGHRDGFQVPTPDAATPHPEQMQFRINDEPWVLSLGLGHDWTWFGLLLHLMLSPCPLRQMQMSPCVPHLLASLAPMLSPSIS